MLLGEDGNEHPWHSERFQFGIFQEKPLQKGFVITQVMAQLLLFMVLFQASDQWVFK
jgi:hypothetical protein